MELGTEVRLELEAVKSGMELGTEVRLELEAVKSGMESSAHVNRSGSSLLN